MEFSIKLAGWVLDDLVFEATDWLNYSLLALVLAPHLLRTL